MHNLLRTLPLLFLLAPLVGCDDGGGGDVGTTTEVTFEGEQAAVPDYAYDTGYLPAESPIQVRLNVETAGVITTTAGAIVGGSPEAPVMQGKAGSGTYALSMRLVFQVLLKVDLAAVSYEGAVSENTDVQLEITGETTFDPFLLDGTTAQLETEVPETLLATIPLAGTVPGVEGNLILNIAGTVRSGFRGTCAAVGTGPDAAASYAGETTTSADLIVRPTVHVKIPLVLDETLEAFDVPVTIPETALAMDLGSHVVTAGGGAIDAGGSEAIVGTCEGGGVGPDAGPTDTVDSDAGPDPDTVIGDDTVGDDIGPIPGDVDPTEDTTVTPDADTTTPDTVTPDATPDTTPDTTPDVTPDATPDVTPDTTPDTTPDVTPDTTPDVTPDTTPDVTPDTTPDTTPDVTPDTTPDVEPDTTPDTTPDVEPDTTPDTTPDVEPDTTPDTTPDVDAGPTPCSGDGDCAPGETCTDGVCSEAPVSCQGDLDCLPGEACLGEQCTSVTDCCGPTGTTGCDDTACSDLVCGMDSYCCDTAWDEVCGEHAILYCDVCGGELWPCSGDQECFETEACVDGFCQWSGE